MIPLGVLAQRQAAAGVDLPTPVFAWAFNETGGTTATATIGTATLALNTNIASFGAGVNGNALHRASGTNTDRAATVDGVTTNSSTWTEITMAAWVYPTSNTGQYVMAMNNGNGRNGTDVVGVTHNSGYVFINGTVRNNSAFTPAAHSSWRHVAMTWKSGDPIRMYEDGTLKSETTAYSGAVWRGSSSTNVAHIKALSIPWDVGANYAARLDDFRIYNAQLSAAQLTALMSIPVT